MFKFNFDVEEDLEDVIPGVETSEDAQSNVKHAKQHLAPEASFIKHSIESLLSALPSVISFSPLHISLSNADKAVALSRRDLFDARFQLLQATETNSEETLQSHDKTSEVHENGELEFLEAPSDLVPGVYEGGLKTWECSLDLVDCLDFTLEGDCARRIRGKRVLELGCGTAVPSLYLLNQLFSFEPSYSAGEVNVHLQDYNDLVLRLVTLPNVILAWYMSPASQTYRSSFAASMTTPEWEAEDAPPPADPMQPGELPITPALTSAFLKSLSDYKIEVLFFSGSWLAYDLAVSGGGYDLILTSETIYRPDSLSSLVGLMYRACQGSSKTEVQPPVEERLENLTVDDMRLCLVAAKLVYFGVGGGVNDFVSAVQDPPRDAGWKRGEVKTVWERREGVKRCVMKVLWR